MAAGPLDVICQARTPPPGALRSRCHSFFVSGIGPRFVKDGDALCLQYLGGELDTRRLQIASPFGKELLDYVTAERVTPSAGAVRTMSSGCWIRRSTSTAR